MNDVVTRLTNSPTLAGRGTCTDLSVVVRPVVFLRQAASRHWIVRDENDVRGGTFCDLKAAQKFIRSDFAKDATIIVQPRFAIAPDAPE